MDSHGEKEVTFETNLAPPLLGGGSKSLCGHGHHSTTVDKAAGWQWRFAPSSPRTFQIFGPTVADNLSAATIFLLQGLRAFA